MKLRIAMRSFVDNTSLLDPRIIALRELIRSLVQPSITLRTIITCLTNEGADCEAISLTARLIGLYFGGNKIRDELPWTFDEVSACGQPT